MANLHNSSLEIGRDPLTIENLVFAAKKQIEARLSKSDEFEKKIKKGAAFLDDALDKHNVIYGISTGVGDSCNEKINPDSYRELPINITRMHGVGMGDYFDSEMTRSLMIVRLNTLAQGFSGVSLEMLQFIDFFISNDILPLIPQ